MLREIIISSTLILPIITIAAPVTYTIDPTHTYPHFAIDHLGFSTMHGRFNKTEGSIVIDQEAKTGSVKIIIDAESVDTGHKKRDDHLRSPDFLNAAEFPEITYESTKVSINGNTATVEGELTIAGTSKAVTLNVSKISCGVHPFNKKEVCGFDASATISRADFGITYGSPAIGDSMTLTFEVEGIK
ncbi:MAG: polyisoprenoid-binding protein [Gammaproteobacteria bacterium]|nr:polyisoprenoid-binding protein [Gammaproteobacteria bacterium]